MRERPNVLSSEPIRSGTSNMSHNSQISLTSLSEEQKDSSSSDDEFYRSMSPYRSASKQVREYESKSTFSMASDWSKPIDLKSTDRSLETQDANNMTQGLVDTYKKLLTDIRNVINEQRDTINKKVIDGSGKSKSFYRFS